jgi:hypothetical protein
MLGTSAVVGVASAGSAFITVADEVQFHPLRRTFGFFEGCQCLF